MKMVVLIHTVMCMKGTNCSIMKGTNNSSLSNHLHSLRHPHLLGHSLLSPTGTAPVDPTVAALLEQMQRMQSQQADLQERNAQLLTAALTRPITVQRAPKMHQLPPIRPGPQGEVDIQRFEAHLTSYAIPAERWATELKALLRDELVSVAMSLPPADYAALKQLLLTHMGVSQSTRFSNWLAPKLNNQTL